MLDPILVTGCARSGTSMVAGVINICGAFGGELAGPTPYNKKGMFENLRIKNELVKPYLRSIGADPMGQDPLPDTSSLPIFMDWRTGIESIIIEQGYSSGLWFHKEAKACLIWPVWNFAFPKTDWIIVRRNTDDIIRSCLHTPFMRAFKNTDGWRRWVEHHIRCFREMEEANLNVMEVWPDPAQPLSFKNMISWLGLKWDEEKVTDFLDPSLYHRTSEVVV